MKNSRPVMYSDKNFWKFVWFFITLAIATFGFFKGEHFLRTCTIFNVGVLGTGAEYFPNVHIARLNHLHEETLRYRNLIWTFIPLSWSIYYALMRSRELPIRLPRVLLGLAILFAAFVTSVFYLHCEVMIGYIESQYQALAFSLGLPMQFTPLGGNSFARLFLRPVFACAIWGPPLSWCFFGDKRLDDVKGVLKNRDVS